MAESQSENPEMGERRRKGGSPAKKVLSISPDVAMSKN
jgi:hypothetical protein